MAEIEVLDKKIELNPIILEVGQVAQALKLETYIVGGYVRDIILERPSKDIDFVCVGSGIKLAQAVKDHLGTEAKLAIYKNFGTAAITFKGFELEFVGARKESYRSDSRKPIVENGTLEDDQNRRDFTINALAISLNKENFGALIDPFGGVEHLAQKQIITPLDPEVTFSDDPLRIMRAIRFASQLNFDIEAKTFDAIITQKERIKIISQERISDELNKIILSPVPSYGFKLLFTSGLLQIIFPEMAKLHGVKRINGKGHKDNFYHTLQVLDNICQDTDDLWLRWSAILHDIAKPATQRFHEQAGWTFHGHEDLGAKWTPKIFKRMKLPLNEKMKYVQKLVKLHLRPIALVNEKVTDSAIRRLLYEAGDDIDDLMTLCRADITTKNPKKVKKYMQNFERVDELMKNVQERDAFRAFQSPVGGHEIMEVCAIREGKIVGRIKKAIENAILDGKIDNDHKKALDFLYQIKDDYIS